MEVKDALSGGGSAIHQQFVAVGVVFAFQLLAQLEAEVVQGCGFPRVELKEVAEVAARNDEAMALGDGMDVPDGKKMLIFHQDPLRVRLAERAVHGADIPHLMVIWPAWCRKGMIRPEGPICQLENPA